MAKDVVKAGLIGFGTIGTGVVKLFKNSAALINQKAGVKVELKKICDLDLKTDRGVSVDKSMLTDKVGDIIDDPEIDIVIELIGGYKPALDFMLSAMEKGKHIVTANKALISKHWGELAEAANKNKCEIMAEAAVGGGIPILRGIDKGLAANRIEKIMAILNGTCNYILTKMTIDKMSFDEALKEAQEKGFAEADPTLDIEGLDAMHKIVILSNLSFGKRVKEEDVFVQGIKNVDYMDIEFAGEFGYVMKLLSVAENSGDGINVRVHPVLVAKSMLLASVNYEFNAVYVSGDAVGNTMFYGKGAGEMPTASAVLSDIIYIARNIHNGVERKPYNPEKNKELKIVKIDEIRSKYYMRFNVVDKAGVLAEISGILGSHNISIESMIQKARHSHEKVPVVIMCYESKEADVKKAIEKIDGLGIVKEKTVVYRVIE